VLFYTQAIKLSTERDFMSLLQLEAEILHRLEVGSLYDGLNMVDIDWKRQMKMNALLVDLYETDRDRKEIFTNLRFLRDGNYWFFKNTNIRAAFRVAVFTHANRALHA
jgi:hypothetical protein